MTSIMKMPKNKEAEKYLRDRGLDTGGTVMADKKEPGTATNQTVKLTTNMFALKQRKTVTVYRYEVKIEGIIPRSEGANLIIDITETTSRDFLNVDRRFICRDVLKAYVQRNEAKLKEKKNMLYYDLSRTLFALKNLKVSKFGTVEEFAAEKIINVSTNGGTKHFPRYSLTITPVSAGDGKLTVGDLDASLTNDVAKMDMSLVQFLNIATAQNVFNDTQGKFMHYSASSIFLMYPQDFGFIPADSPSFDTNSSFLGIGMDKSVRVIEADTHKPEGPRATLVVQVSKTPFHLVETVFAKIQTMFPQRNGGPMLNNGQLGQASRMLRGLYVHTTYPANDPQMWQRFVIYGFSSTNAQTELLVANADGDQQTVERYYEHRHNIKLIHPCAPLVTRRERGKTTHYPMELLKVCDYQRVRSYQMTPDINQEMIKKCAIPPALLRQQTQQLKDALNLGKSDDTENGDGGHLKALSIKCAARPLEVEARILNPGEIQYGNELSRLDMACRWRSASSKYLLPAQINRWCAIALVDTSHDNNINPAGWREFVNRYSDVMREKGIRFQKPDMVERLPVGNCDIRQEFNKLRDNGTEFVLIGHPKGHLGDVVHHTMKYFELHTEVISQGVLISTVLRTAKKPSRDTFENLVSKTNVKMGGLNYALPLSNGMLNNTLVIGFAINHPAGGLGMGGTGATTNGSSRSNGSSSETGSDVASDNNGNGDTKGNKSAPRTGKCAPSVVGYAANIGPRHKFEFIGDYKFQEARLDEKLHLIDHIVCRCLDMYMEREKQYPSSVIIYRNACGEGFYQHLLKYEVPLVKSLVNNGRCNAKLTMIVVNKLQSIRFTTSNITGAKADDQNVRPGTVVDKGIVSPKWSEFFLASQRALQGTARVPRYAILVDDNGFAMDQLQQFTFGLCFGHQIVTSPISLPAPVYIALEYAKRGRNNYNIDQAAETRAENWDTFGGPNANFCLENKLYLSKWRVNA